MKSSTENSNPIYTIFKKISNNFFDLLISSNISEIDEKNPGMPETKTYQDGLREGLHKGLRRGIKRGKKIGVEEGSSAGVTETTKSVKNLDNTSSPENPPEISRTQQQKFEENSKEEFEKGFKKGFDMAQKKYQTTDNYQHEQVTGLNKQDYFTYLIQTFEAMTLNEQFRDEPRYYLEHYKGFLFEIKERLSSLQCMPERNHENMRMRVISEIDAIIVKLNFQLTRDKVILFSEDDLQEIINLANEYGKIEGFIKAYDIFGIQYHRKLGPQLMNLDQELGKLKNKEKKWDLNVFEFREKYLQDSIDARLKKGEAFGIKTQVFHKYLTYPFTPATKALAVIHNFANHAVNAAVSSLTNIRNKHNTTVSTIDFPGSFSESAPKSNPHVQQQNKKALESASNSPCKTTPKNTRHDFVPGNKNIHPLLRPTTPTPAGTSLNVTGNEVNTITNFPSDLP